MEREQERRDRSSIDDDGLLPYLSEVRSLSSYVSIPIENGESAAATTAVDLDSIYADRDYLSVNEDDQDENEAERSALLSHGDVDYRQSSTQQPLSCLYRFIHLSDIFLSIVFFSPLVAIFW